MKYKENDWHKKVPLLVMMLAVLSSFSFRNHANAGNCLKNNIRLNDTLPFTPNGSEGWDMYSSYLKLQGDSVVFEVILKRQVSAGNIWAAYSDFGTIDTAYFPHNSQMVTAREPNRLWSIIVQADGKCLIKLIEGPQPEGSLIVLPFQTKYKK